MSLKNYKRKRLIRNIGGIGSAVCFSLSAATIDTVYGRFLFFLAFLLFQLWLFTSKYI